MGWKDTITEGKSSGKSWRETIQDEPVTEESSKSQFEEKNPMISGLLSGAGKIAGAAGRAIDYLDSPIRSAIDAPAKVIRGEEGLLGALSDIPAQLIPGTKNAPQLSEIAARYGVSTERQKVSPIAATHSLYSTGSDEIIPEEEKVELPSPAEQIGTYGDLAIGGSGIGLLAKGVGRAARAIQKPMKAASEAMAIKQAGGMLGDFRKIEKKGQLENLGQTLLKGEVEIPTERGVRKEKLLKAGDTVERIAEKTSLKKEQLGSRLGEIYDKIDAVGPEELKNLKVNKFDPKIDLDEARSHIEKQLGSIGKKDVMSYVDSVLEDIKLNGNSLNDTQKTLGQVQSEINYSRSIPEMSKKQQAMVALQRFIREKHNKYVEAASDAIGYDTGKKVRDLNKEFSAVSTLDDMAIDKSQRNRANRMMSPTDYAATIGGYMAMGPKGLLALPANYIARTRGPGLLAKGADVLSGTKELKPTDVALSAKSGLLPKNISQLEKNIGDTVSSRSIGYVFDNINSEKLRPLKDSLIPQIDKLSADNQAKAYKLLMDYDQGKADWTVIEEIKKLIQE